MPEDRLPDHLLRHGYNRERENALANLRREAEFAARQLQTFIVELDTSPDSTVFSGHARQLGATVAELLTRAGQLDMANRLVFLNPAIPEEG
ncbi:hypothetical protein [Nonomuraea bangladeshensis]|uniref:hypothetical protein n=1 Tax=Nonomuraea bangladeshensis TaxID=404385 RepID=UPI003C2C41D0